MEAEIASAIAKSPAAAWVPGTAALFPEPQPGAPLRLAARAAPPAWDRAVVASAEAVAAEAEAPVAEEGGDNVHGDDVP